MTTKTCAQGCKKDFGCVPRNWCCYGADPALFGTSQWKCGHPILFLLLYRLPWALFWVAYYIYDVYERINRTYYFELLTKWQLTLIVLNSVVGLIVASIMQAGHMKKKWNHFLGFYWVLWNTATAIAPTVTVIFWTLIWDPKILSFDFISIMTHIVNSVYTLIDVMVVAIPLRAYHFYPAAIVATVYIIFAAIHEVITNKIIYAVFKFREKPGSSVAFWFGGIAIGICMWYCVFGLYKLRVFIAEKCNANQSDTKEEDVEADDDTIATIV